MAPSITLILDDVVRVHAQGQMLLLRVDDIVAIRSRENYSIIHFADERTTTVRIPLKTWAEQLPAEGFLRVHRTMLVNRRRVRECRYLGPKKWVLQVNGLPQSVAVGRLYWPQLKSGLSALSPLAGEREFAVSA